jgi:hypothetical protein
MVLYQLVHTCALRDTYGSSVHLCGLVYGFICHIKSKTVETGERGAERVERKGGGGSDTGARKHNL